MAARPKVEAPKQARNRERALGTAANQMTTLRLFMIPLLWVVAALGKPAHLGIGVAVAGSTDVLDGYLARRSGQTTAFGSRLDSIADHLLTLSTALWLLWLRPDFVREQLLALLLWGALGVLVLLVGWARFRRLGDLHLYSAKLAGTAGYLFAIWLLIFGSYHPAVFAVVIGLCYFSALESLVALLLRRGVDEHMGTAFGRRGPA
jgi:phosphatidylglycerophosphate synthase